MDVYRKYICKTCWKGQKRNNLGETCDLHNLNFCRNLHFFFTAQSKSPKLEEWEYFFCCNSYTCLWLPSIFPLKWQPSKTSCVWHLWYIVHIPLSGVLGRPVEILGLQSQVMISAVPNYEVIFGPMLSVQRCKMIWMLISIAL